jgi:hypothetical protein
MGASVLTISAKRLSVAGIGMCTVNITAAEAADFLVRQA